MLHECRVFSAFDGSSLCEGEGGCYAAEKLRHDLSINPGLKPDARMSRSCAMRYAQVCRSQGCGCADELEQIATLFPEATGDTDSCFASGADDTL